MTGRGDDAHPGSLRARWATVLLLVVMTFVPNNGASFKALILGYTVCIAAVALSLMLGAFNGTVSTVTLLAVLFHWIIFASSLNNTATPFDLAHFTLVAGLMVSIAWLSSSIGPRHRLGLIRSIILLSLAQAAIAISQTLFSSPIAWGYLGEVPVPTVGVNSLLGGSAERAVGTLAHPIPLAVLLGAGLLLVIFNRAAWPNTVRLPLVGVLGIAVVFSGTRSAIVALIAAAIIGLMGRQRTGLSRVAKSLVTLVAVVALGASNVAREAAIFQSLQGSFSLENRLGAWTVGERLLTEQTPIRVLVGGGIDAGARLGSEGLLYASTFGAIDNNFVTVLAMGGLAGFLVFILILVTGVKTSRSDTFPTVIFLVLMCFSFDLTVWTPTLALILALASLSSASQQDSEPISLDGEQALPRPSSFHSVSLR